MTNMKRLFLAVVLFFLLCSSNLFGEISFPESLYLVDTRTGYKIMLGISPEFIEREYGAPQEKILRRIFKSPYYEIWSWTYENFEIWYQTYSNMITDIEVKDDIFCTSSGIRIGSSLSDVVESYGENPTYISHTKNGELVYQYNAFLKEINLEGETTVLHFTFFDNKVNRISFCILNEV